MHKYLLTAAIVSSMMLAGSVSRKASAQGCYSDFGGVYADVGHPSTFYSDGWGGYSDSYSTAYLGYYPRSTVRTYYPSHYAPSLFNFQIGGGHGHRGHSRHYGGHHGHGGGHSGHHF